MTDAEEEARPRSRHRRHRLSLTFDEDSRREYLTGFSKRKLQRQQRALQEAEARVKAERVETRKRIRESLAEMNERSMNVIDRDDLDARTARLLSSSVADSSTTTTKQFVDEFTNATFGEGMVTVTTTTTSATTCPNGIEHEATRKKRGVFVPRNTRMDLPPSKKVVDKLRERLTKKKTKKNTASSFRSNRRSSSGKNGSKKKKKKR